MIFAFGHPLSPEWQLSQSGVSDNVGDVKHFLSVLRRALAKERHFALAEGFAVPNPGSLAINSGQATQFDPCISSVTSSIMITSSNSSVKRSGLPSQLLDVVLRTIA
jgi:hypothetical protein